MFQVSFAQNEVHIRYLDNSRYPFIRVNFDAYCNGEKVLNISGANVKTFENNYLMNEETIHCSEDQSRKPFSFQFVFDASSSMTDHGLEKYVIMKRAGHQIVSEMVDGVDEGSVLYFEDAPWYEQTQYFIKNKELLHTEVQSVPVNYMSSTAIWDAMVEAVNNVALNANNQNRMILLFTDGGDNVSKRDIDEVIYLAQKNKIRVYSIFLADAQDYHFEPIQRISRETGGRTFISPDSLTMENIVDIMVNDIRTGFNECYVEYETHCPNGTFRSVRLELNGICGTETLVDTTSYQAPDDPSEYSLMSINVVAQNAGNSVTFEFQNGVLFPDNVCPPFTTSFQYDKSCMTFLRGSTNGSILQGSLIVEEKNDHVVITMLDSSNVSQIGKLFSLDFRKSSGDNLCGINVLNFDFLDACMLTTVSQQFNEDISCELIAPDTIRFLNGNYDPLEFDVECRVYNNGSTAIHGVDVYMLQDERFIIVGAPSAVIDVIPPNSYRSVMFRMETTFSDEEKTSYISGIALSSFLQTRCEYPIYVEKVRQPKYDIKCWTFPDTVLYSTHDLKYMPDTIWFNIEVENIGDEVSTDTRIFLLETTMTEFAPGEDAYRYVGNLNPGQKVSYQWKMVPIKSYTSGKEDAVFTIRGNGGYKNMIHNERCGSTLYYRSEYQPEYDISCQTENIQFDESKKVYNPVPFRFDVTIKNVGKDRGKGVLLTVLLPEGVELAPGYDQTQWIPWIDADQTLERFWNLIPTKENFDRKLGVAVTAEDIDKNSAFCVDSFTIDAFKSSLYDLKCEAIPDTVPLSSTGSRYLSDTVIVRCNIKNTGETWGASGHATLLIQSSRAWVLQKTKVIPTLLSGEEFSVEWIVRVLPTATAEDVQAQILVVSGVDEYECNTHFYLPAPTVYPIMCDLQTVSRDTLIADGTPLLLNAFITNMSAHEKHDVQVRVSWLGGISLSDGESDLWKVGTMSLDEIRTHTWKFEPIKNIFGESYITIQITSDEGLESDCTRRIVIVDKYREQKVYIRDVVADHGKILRVPIHIEGNSENIINSVGFNIQYNSDHLRFLGYDDDLFFRNRWSITKMQSLSENVLRFENYTNSPKPIPEDNVLLTMNFETKIQNDYLKFSSIKFVNIGSYLNVFNSTDPASPGDVIMITEDGDVYLSNGCVISLSGKRRISNAPNPAINQTTIRYILDNDTNVNLILIDRLGRLVKTLINDTQIKGEHTYVLNTHGFSAGMYIYTLTTDNFIVSRKLNIIR